jgi:L-lactate dehydrogenase complex protein LldG
MPRNYIRRGKLDHGALIAMMIERLRDYDAEVVECVRAQLPETIEAQLRNAGKGTIVVPREIPAAWLVPHVDWLIDHELSAGEIEKVEGVLTVAFCGIADSGTIVLHHSGTEGRRMLTLLPDWHLCILRASQVVETLPEYFDRCEQPPSLATLISGPSATADIEMTRIKGVHGPRFMVVILVRDS